MTDAVNMHPEIVVWLGGGAVALLVWAFGMTWTIARWKTKTDQNIQQIKDIVSAMTSNMNDLRQQLLELDRHNSDQHAALRSEFRESVEEAKIAGEESRRRIYEKIDQLRVDLARLEGGGGPSRDR